MAPASRFPRKTLAQLDASKILRISAGGGDHRFIGIWAVVVDGRVFIRSWNDKPGGWYRALVAHPRARIEVDKRTVAVRAKFVRSQRIIEAVDDAYAAKYTTPGSRKYVRGFRLKRRRTTTTELVPA